MPARIPIAQPQQYNTHQTSFRSTISNNSYQPNQPYQSLGSLHPPTYVQPANLIQPTNLIQQTNYITNNFTHSIPSENKEIKVNSPPIIYQSYPNIYATNNPG